MTSINKYEGKKVIPNENLVDFMDKVQGNNDVITNQLDESPRITNNKFQHTTG